jgi:hypothetical protein
LEGIARLRDEAPDLSVFNRINLLYMAKQALLVASPDGQPVANRSDIERIGICFLMANDLVLGYEPSKADSLLQSVAGLMPFPELVVRESLVADITRNRVLLHEILDRPRIRQHKHFRDLRAEYCSRFGMTFERFCALVVAVSTRFALPQGDKELFSTGPCLGADFFRNTTVPPEEIEAFFVATARTEEQMKRLLEEAAGPVNFDPIQRFPLVALSDGSRICLDPAYLLEKAGKSFYWTLRSIYDDAEGSRLKEFWGAMLEEYLHWLFQNCYQGEGSYMSPTFADGTPAFDGCLVEGSVLVAMEYKSSILTAIAKRSFSESALRPDLVKKFVASQKNENKGVGQLRAVLERWCGGDEICGLEDGRIHKVIPVLVCLDDAMASPGVARYLDSILCEHRTRIGKRAKKTITPLFVVTLPDLEYLLKFTTSMLIQEMLQKFAQLEPSRSGLIRFALGKDLKKLVPAPDTFGQRFDQIVDDFKALFPEQSALPRADT